MMLRSSKNKGVTLIELISAIAILSIVGISAFTLLMFSIRSNNMIVSGTSAAQDADILNKRLELLLEDENCFIKLVKAESTTSSIIFHTPEEPEDGALNADDESKPVYVPTGESLVFENDALSLKSDSGEDPELLQDRLSYYAVERISNTNLLKISYTIGERKFVKLFRVKFAEETKQQ